MANRVATSSRRAFRIWYAFLAIGLCVVIAVNVALALHIGRVREWDYRVYLDEASKDVERNDLVVAAAHVEDALLRAPTQPEPHVMLGHIEYRLHHWERAIVAYRNAIERGSQDLGIRANIVWCLIEMKRYGEASARGRQMLDEGLSSPLLLRYIGEAEFRAGRLPAAIPYFEAALEAAPDDLYMLECLGQALAAVGGQQEKAARVQERIEKIRARFEQLGATSP